jgi:putative pyrimidine permease RutG
MAIQHVLAMFGATVLGPILMGFDSNVALIFSGVGTLIFYVAVRGKVPSFLGSSFAFIAAVTAATSYTGSGPNTAIPLALSGIVAAGILYVALGILVSFTGPKLINAVFPPEVTGVIVGIIGLNLAGVAVKDLAGGPIYVSVGLFTLVTTVLINVYVRGFPGKLAILFGALLGTALYFLLGNVLHLMPIMSNPGLSTASWIGLPHFQTPVFDPGAISLIAPIAIVLVAENLGHVKAIGGMTHRNLDASLWRAFVGDGLATIVSGLGGGPGVTTYAENMSAMRMSQNFSSLTLVLAGVIAICLGFSPKFGALLHVIPTPVLGGLAFTMFGLIAATAGTIWQQGHSDGLVDFDKTRTLLVAGPPLIVGAGNLTIDFGTFWIGPIKIQDFSLGGIVMATLMVIVLYHLTSFSNRPSPLESDENSNPHARQ